MNVSLDPQHMFLEEILALRVQIVNLLKDAPPNLSAAKLAWSLAVLDEAQRCFTTQQRERLLSQARALYGAATMFVALRDLNARRSR